MRLLIFDEYFLSGWDDLQSLLRLQKRIYIYVHVYSRLPNHLRTDNSMRACSRERGKRKIDVIWLSVFRHAARRRNVRTAPTMMPKQYTHKRALRLRQNSLLKLVLNLRARSICDLYMKKISDKKRRGKRKKQTNRQKRRNVISRRETIVTYLKYKYSL